jgi:hypothetical protein
MNKEINRILETEQGARSQGDTPASDLPGIAMFLSIVAIVTQIICLLMVNHDPSGLSPLIRYLKPLTYFGNMVIAVMAFILGGIALYSGAQPRKKAIVAMVTSVVSVVAFHILMVINFLLTFRF